MKKLSSILLIFFCISSFAQQDSEITYLSCTGTENATSFYKNPKGETQDISTDFTLNFNAQQKKVTGGTRMLALGCFPTEDIDLAKSTCDCRITEEVIECKSIGYMTKTKLVHEDEFSVNRRTAGMTTFRTWVSDGKVKLIYFGQHKCKKIAKKF
jgi:hypothetical protein